MIDTHSLMKTKDRNDLVLQQNYGASGSFKNVRSSFHNSMTTLSSQMTKQSRVPLKKVSSQLKKSSQQINIHIFTSPCTQALLN